AKSSIGESTPTEANATTVLLKQLAARYNFDENTGTTAADASGNNNTAMINAAGTTWTTGKFGSALAFDGTVNAYVTVPNATSLNPGVQISAAAWINPTTWANGNHLVLQKGSSDNQYGLTAETGGLEGDSAGIGIVHTTLPST